MAKKRFNWKFAIVLVLAFAVVAVTAYALRQWNRTNRAATALDLGNKAYQQGNWHEAIVNLGRYVATAPDDVSILTKYADAHLNIRPLKIDNIQQAVGAYRQILRIDKGNSDVTEKLMGVYLQMNTPAEAEFIARESLKACESPTIRRLLAVTLGMQRKFRDASDELTAIIEKHPNEILAYEVLGQFARQHPEDISLTQEQCFNDLVQNNPQSPQAYILRASYYLRLNDRDHALSDLAQAEKLGISDPLVKLRLTNEYLAMDNFDKVKLYLQAIQTEIPENQALWQTWAQFALRSGEKPLMLWVAGEGLKTLATKKWDFMPTAIDLSIQAGQYDQASDYIKQLRDIEMLPAVLAYYEGVIAYLNDQNYQAIERWQLALELGNKSEKLHLMLAEVLEKVGNIQAATQQMAALVVRQPESFQGHLKYAKLLASSGKWIEAAEQTRLALQTTTGSLDAILLDIQIKMQMLQQSGIEQTDPQWKTIENQVAQLKKVAQKNIEVNLVEFQIALILRQYERAETLLQDMKKSGPAAIKVAMAEIELLRRQDRTDQIEPTLRKIISDYPQSTVPVKSLAILLSSQDKMIECEKVLNDAAARITHLQAQRELNVLLADLYRSHGTTDKAYAVMETLSGRLPQDISVKRWLLSYKQTLDNTSKAQELIEQIKTLEGRDGWQWRYEQAKLWLNADDLKNNYAQIVSLLKENLQSNPDDNASRMLLAAAHEQAGSLQLALAAYREAYNRSPQDLSVIIPAVAALNKAAEFSEANEILDRAARQKIYHQALSGLRFQSYIGLGEFESGANVLENLLKNDPDNRQVQLQIALLKMRQNKLTDAQTLLDKLRSDDPDSLPVLVALIELRVKQNQSETAIALCDELIKKQNDSAAFLVRAKTFAMLNMPDKAEADLKHAAGIDPDNISLWLDTCNFYRSQSQPEQAISAIRKALALDPANLKTQKLAVGLLLSSRHQEDIARGTAVLEQALTANPDDVQLRLYKVQTLLALGTRQAVEQSAVNILQDITEDYPESADAWLFLGELALRQDQPGKAMDMALKGLISSPENRDLLLLKAHCEGASSPSLAIPTLNTLMQLYPDDVDIALYLARAYTAAGDAQKAIAMLQEKITSCKGDNCGKLDIALAAAKYASGDKDQAMEQLDILAKAAPDDPDPILTQARLLKDDHRWDELVNRAAGWYDSHSKAAELLLAISNELAMSQDDAAKKSAEQILRLLLDKQPQNISAIQSLATLLQILNQIDDSAQLYQKLLELAPDNVIAINNLAWILSEYQNNYQQALELAQKGLQQKPDYLDLLDTRGVIYYRLAQYDKAMLDFNKCLELYPTQAPGLTGSYFHLGRTQARMGQKDQALKNLRQALDLNKKNSALSKPDLDEASRLADELSQGI